MKTQLYYGIHVINSILTHCAWRVRTLYLLNERHDERIQSIRDKAEQNGVPIVHLNKEKMAAKLPKETHQGVMADCAAAPIKQDNDLLDDIQAIEKPLLLILDGVTDPHNLGACLRSAEACGVNAVILPKHQSAPLNPTVSKSACGAAECLTVYTVTNLARCIEQLKSHNIFVIGAAGETKNSIYDMQADGPLAIVMGAEGKGLRRLTKESCDQLVAIPMQGYVESLNVSVATGVMLYEVVRQRQG